MDQTTQGQAVNFFGSLLIKGKTIPTSNIISIVIRTWAFEIVPRLELVINDDGILTEAFPLLEGDEIDVVLGKNITDNNPLATTFELMDHSFGSMMGGKFAQIMISGVLKLDGFYAPERNRSFRNRTSLDVLSQIASEAGIEFRTSTGLLTNDLMIWLQIHSTNLEMCKHVIRRAYRPNDLLFFYFDTKGYAQLRSFAMEKTMSPTMAFLDLQKYSAESYDNGADLNTVWFNTYSSTNYSGSINKTKVYGVNYEYLSPVDSSVVSGMVFDDAHDFTGLSTQNQNNTKQPINTQHYGYLNNSVHQNYFKAQASNDYYRHLLTGGEFLSLSANALCDVSLLDIINVNIPSMAVNGLNLALSGNYWTAGIIHSAGRGQIYKKKLILCRNGINDSKWSTEQAQNQIAAKALK